VAVVEELVETFDLMEVWHLALVLAPVLVLVFVAV